MRWQMDSRGKALEATLSNNPSSAGLRAHLPAVATVEPQNAPFPVSLGTKEVGMVATEQLLEKTVFVLESDLGKGSGEHLACLLSL